MTGKTSRNEDILTKARALIKPQQDVLTRSFQESLAEIRRQGGQPDSRMDRAAKARVGAYVTDSIGLVADSLVRVIRAKDIALSEESVAYLLTSLIPDLNGFRTFIYENVKGVGLSTGIDLTIAMEDAHRLATEHQAATLMLCATIDDHVRRVEPNNLPSSYSFHPSIEACAGQLYQDGHYKQAALEAYICVIEAVRTTAGLKLDGDDLMNQVFGSSERRTPILQVNGLQTTAERDEQKGFMFLFKGVVGLRNFKAHSNRLFDDPLRAHEYLALSSLLLRIIELAQVNRPVVT